MKILGHIEKSGKLWTVELPALHLFTQGTSKDDAYEMAVAVVEDIIGEPGFKCSLEKSGLYGFELSSNDDSRLLALLLRQQRLKSGLTVREASLRLGSNSPNAYGVYEQGRAKPTLEKLQKLLKAVDADIDLKVG